VSGKGVLIPVKVFKKIGLYNSEKLPHYHGDTELIRRAYYSGFKVFVNLNAIIFTDHTASGIGQANSKISLREFILSFKSLRSENHFRSLYNRARLIYGRKWLLYLIVNISSIIARFFIRYSRSLFHRVN
jgi:GT2 family glycosyltransferase